MIVVAGPVNAGRAAEGWVQDPDMAKIRRLYPVEFNQGLSTRSNVTYSSEEPWPLEFTREGLQAAYLWLGDSAIASQATWSQFSGVYSFCPVRDKKAGATVLARFGDPRTAQGGQQPIYMAVHRYSASPVLYLGSAETWRLRRVDPALVRPVLDQDDPLRGPGAPPPPVVARFAIDRSRPLQRGQLRWKCGHN